MNKANNSSDEFYNNRNMNRYYPESFREPVTRFGKNSIAEQRKLHGSMKNQQKVDPVQIGKELKENHKTKLIPATKRSTKPLNQDLT